MQKGRLITNFTYFKVDCSSQSTYTTVLNSAENQWIIYITENDWGKAKGKEKRIIQKNYGKEIFFYIWIIKKYPKKVLTFE